MTMTNASGYSVSPTETDTEKTMPRRHSMDNFETSTATTPPAEFGTEPIGKNTSYPQKQKVKRAVSSTAKRVAEAEALLRKRKLKLREEQELTVLRTIAGERLGSDCSAKNRNAIFDALIADFGLE